MACPIVPLMTVSLAGYSNHGHCTTVPRFRLRTFSDLSKREWEDVRLLSNMTTKSFPSKTFVYYQTGNRKKQHVSFLFQMIFFSDSEIIKLWTIHNSQISVFGSVALRHWIFFMLFDFDFLTYIYIFSTIQNYNQVIEHNSLNEETGKNQFSFICCYI